MAKHGLWLMAAAVSAVATVAPANAQRSADPNLGHFYMGRQQIEIIDESPQVQYRTNGGAAGPSGGFSAPGANGPVALPRAGFQSYTPIAPPVNNSLPRVPNGVPPKLPPSGPMGANGMRAQAGALPGGAKARTAAKKPAGDPNAVKAYKSYKGYGGPVTTPAVVAPPVGLGFGNQQSSTNVQGSVLHWARKNRGGM